MGYLLLNGAGVSKKEGSLSRLYIPHHRKQHANKNVMASSVKWCWCFSQQISESANTGHRIWYLKLFPLPYYTAWHFQATLRVIYGALEDSAIKVLRLVVGFFFCAIRKVSLASLKISGVLPHKQWHTVWSRQSPILTNGESQMYPKAQTIYSSFLNCLIHCHATKSQTAFLLLLPVYLEDKMILTAWVLRSLWHRFSWSLMGVHCWEKVWQKKPLFSPLLTLCRVAVSLVYSFPWAKGKGLQF